MTLDQKLKDSSEEIDKSTENVEEDQQDNSEHETDSPEKVTVASDSSEKPINPTNETETASRVTTDEMSTDTTEKIATPDQKATYGDSSDQQSDVEGKETHEAEVGNEAKKLSSKENNEPKNVEIVAVSKQDEIVENIPEIE